MTTVDQDEHIVLSVVLLVITVTCLGVSFWSMAKGYETMAGSIYLSSAIAFVLVMMMFGLNYSLRRGLMRGIPKSTVVGTLALYFVVTLFSFSGIFNKFYSGFMHTELVNEELEAKKNALVQLRTNAVSLLTNVEERALRDKVQGLIEQLKLQILSPAEPGIGPKARAILSNIQSVLKLEMPITIIPPRSTSTKDLTDLGLKYENMIIGQLNTSEALSKLNAPEKRDYAGKINGIINPVVEDLKNKQSNLGSGDDTVAISDAISSLRHAVETYKDVALNVNNLSKEKPLDYDTAMTVENDRIGKISHTYESAIAHINHWGVWISALLALAIDLIVPIFVFFLTPRGKTEPRSRGGKGPGVLSKDF